MPTTIDKPFSKKAKIRLVKLDLKVTQLASDLNKPRPTVSSVVNGSRRYPRLRALIVEHLKLDRP